MHRFACEDLCLKESLFTHGDCCTASQHGESTHRLHHFYLEVTPLETHLEYKTKLMRL